MTDCVQSGSLEDEVLRVFQQISPSRVVIEQPPVWKDYSAKVMHRVISEYKLPLRVFKGASVLDVGCGTGEKSLIFASWGAQVTGVDYDETALQRATHLRSISRFPTRLLFYQGRLPNLPEPVRSQQFDIVHADGVLHHTEDPVASLDEVASRVASGGWLVVRNYQAITALQRLLKRLIVRLGSCGDDEKIIANTKRLFSEDVQRSVASGGRTEDQALYDNFVNPRYRPFSHQAVSELCDRLGFRIHALTPSIDGLVLLGPGPLLPLLGDAGLLQAWWATTLARAAVATESPLSLLESERGPLEACCKACHELEESLNDLLNEVTAKAWDSVVDSVFRYLSASRVVAMSLYERAEHQSATFLQELRAIQPLIRTAVERQLSVAVLPETKVLFRKMSGFPMASWVLWNPEPQPGTPFNLQGNCSYG